VLPGRGAVARRLARLLALIGQRQALHRRRLLLGKHAGLYSLSYVFEHTGAMRWLDQTVHNAPLSAA
jgi:phosphate:Na+ symporter